MIALTEIICYHRYYMEAEKNHRLFSFFTICFAGIGGLLYGYDLGIIAGALIFMKHEIALSAGQISILIAAVLGGGSLATLISGLLSDWFGRRTMITASALIFIIGVTILVSSQTFLGVLGGRLIEGVGVGIITIVIPLYLTEALPAGIRGRGVSAFQLFLTTGILSAYLVSLLFAHARSWRAMFICSLLPAVILLIGSFFMIESPRWLFFKDKKARALNALQKSRSQQEAEHDLYLMTQLEIENRQKKKFVWRKHYIWPFAIAFSIAVLNQLTGINVFLQLCTLIVKNSGLTSTVTSMLGSVGIGLMNFLFTFLAMLIIDRAGRKLLLIIGTGGLTLSLVYLGALSYFLTPGVLQGYLMIIGFILFIISFAIGPGAIVWLAISELIPTAIRGRSMSICLFANSLTSAIFASVFLKLAHVIGYAGVFWLCGFFSLIYLLVAVFFLPESKNKSLEEIEQSFKLHCRHPAT